MTGETSSPVIVIATIYSWMGWGIPRTPDDVTEHSQLTMQRFLEVLSSPDKQLVTSVMSGSQHTVHLLINNICIYAASNLFRSKLINIYYNPIIHHNMGYTYSSKKKLLDYLKGHCIELKYYFKGALYRIWCSVNRLSDSGVKVV